MVQNILLRIFCTLVAILLTKTIFGSFSFFRLILIIAIQVCMASGAKLSFACVSKITVPIFKKLVTKEQSAAFLGACIIRYYLVSFYLTFYGLRKFQ